LSRQLMVGWSVPAYRFHQPLLSGGRARDMTSRIQYPAGRRAGGPIDLHSVEPGTHLIGLYQGEAELAGGVRSGNLRRGIAT